MSGGNERLRGRCSNDAVVLKYCTFLPSKRCFHSSCGFLDSSGNVRLCKFHPNSRGRFTSKKYVSVGVNPVVLSPKKCFRRGDR